MHKTTYELSASKSLRSFIFTTLAVSSPFYLLSLGYNSIEIGIALFVSMVSSTMFVYLFPAIKIKNRTRAFTLATLLSISLVILIFYHSIIFYIVAVIVGGISLSGRDLTANLAIEQYTISHYEVDRRSKNHAFSIYNFSSYGVGAAASASLLIYRIPDYNLLFLIDLVMAVAQFIPYAMVKFPDIEKQKIRVAMDEKTSGNVRSMKYLFSMDALGGGLVNTAILSLWFNYVYHITLSEAGIIFLVVNIVTALSILISSKLSNRMGVVRTMVYTHLVSNVFLILIPVYHSLVVSEIFLFLRQTTSQMDVPARDSFTNTIIPGEYRLKANSVFNSVRTGFQVPGPLISSILIDVLPSTVFYSAGLIKVGYDLLFFSKYRDFREA
ncbi:MFS transporter [Oxyplasma meridianum]|uniref:MFS transporter n=1 Tax=Oxyplasma meridianum TaxID=3073602 RepID=A0AAX4NIV7_9ARCH